MKKLIIAMAAGFAALPAYGQGMVNFNNRVTGLIDARVMLPDGTGAAGTGWVAQLYGGPPDGRLTPLTPTTTFRTTSAAAMGYINAVNLAIPGVPPEQEATVIMRAFKGTSWETAMLRGE